jgi:ABC-2 type transport system permease protein
MVKKQKLILTNRREAIISLVLMLTILLLLNVVSRYYYFRLDLTSEQRYSISKPTKEMVRDLKDIVTVKVYLDGDLNAGFTRLKESTRNLLKEFRAYGGKNIEYEFINPMGIQNLDDRKTMITDLMQRGLAPTNLTTKSKTESKQQLIFPGAIVTYAGRQMPVQLLDNQIGYGPEEILNHSEIQLEYKFANAIQKLTQSRPPRIVFVHGHGELAPIETEDLRQTLEGLQFEVKDIDLRSTYYIPTYTDVIIVAKPRGPFDEKDKYKIDQYIMHGGKVIWLLDGTDANMDSLRIDRGVQFVVGNDYEFNLDDMLFKYGVRINADVVQDINMCNPIPIVTGQMGNAPQTQMFPWYYYPMLISDNNHSIIKNLDPVASFFPSSVDTIRNPGVTKTILLHTTENAKAQMAPTRVSIAITQTKPNPGYYNQPKIPVAVLLEGEFESVFKNRMSPEFLAASDTVAALKFVDKSKASKMIVISNGDIIRNEMRSDSTFYPLGYYKFTKQQFANKDFILNCIQYLVDDKGILETRNKEVKLRMLNGVKVEDEKLKWQLINILLPIVLIVLFGIGFNAYRKRRYAS